MVYKKYIKRNGKLYGPYIYHSRRVNGKVISEYQGTGKKIDYKKFIFIFFGVLFVLGLGYGVISNKTKLTGNVAGDLDANYQGAQTLQELEGIINISLSQGEFIPAASKLSFETSKGNYTEYKLQTLLNEELITGDFYIQGKDISGNGLGYGILGEKKIFPLVNFSLNVYSELGEDINGSIILGNVSAEKPFIYDLEQNQTAQIISSSEDINIVIEENIITITTNYFEVEKGFGKDYVGDETKILYINLSELNLVLGGNVKATIFYESEEIISFGTLEQEGDIRTGIIEDGFSTDNKNPIDETKNVNQVSKEIEIVRDIFPLSAEEKQILRSKFGNQSIKSEMKLFNNRTIVRYEYGGVWIESSYNSYLVGEELEEQMEIDRTKWLRDIINQISKEEVQELEVSEQNYSV